MNFLRLEICLFLWTLMNHLVPARGDSFKLHTAKQPYHPYNYSQLSSYGYKVGTSTCIVFEYKGCSNAVFGLMQADNDSKLVYEVLFGGWGNRKSIIRQMKVSRNIKVENSLSIIVDCKESRKLKVGWKDGQITAYRWIKPCEWEILMSWQHTLFSANYIGVTTGTWADGDWIIANEECHEPINRNTLWRNDITRKDVVFPSALFIKPDIHSSYQCAMQCQKYHDCCYYTYNGNHGDCRGFSDLGLSTTSVGTQLWTRY